MMLGLGLSLTDVAVLRRGGGAVAPATFLPTPSAGYAVQWGPYKLVNSAYAGPVFRLVRSTDSATMDVPLASDGQSPDISGVAAWAGAATLKIDIDYDKTGNGLHATQTVDANRPIFVLANAMNGFYPITYGASNTADGLPSTYLNIPAGVTVDMRAHSALLIASVAGPNPNLALFGFGTTSTSYSGGFTSTNSAGVKFGAFAAVDQLGYHFAQQLQSAIPSVAITQHSASALKVRVDSTSYSFTASAVNSYSGGRIGYSFYTASPGAMQCFGLAVTNAALSDVEALAAETAAKAIFKLPASYTRQAIFDGDSRSSGYYGLLKLDSLAQRVALAAPTASYTLGIPSQTMATTYANRNNAIAKFKSGLTKNVIHLWAATNDLEAGTTGTTIWTSYMLPYIQAAQTAGFTVVVCTEIPRSFSTNQAAKDAERQTLNGLINSNQATYGYIISDFASIAAFSNGSGTNNTANPTYYFDGIHPNAAGMSLIVPIARAALAAAGV